MRTKTSKASGDSRGLKRKHVPQRSCVACRQIKSKRELVRLVCFANTVEVDLKGKKPGRGVYLCHSQKCWDAGLKSNRIEYALRTRLSPENRQFLREYFQRLPGKEIRE